MQPIATGLTVPSGSSDHQAGGSMATVRRPSFWTRSDLGKSLPFLAVARKTFSTDLLDTGRPFLSRRTPPPGGAAPFVTGASVAEPGGEPWGWEPVGDDMR
jgi:hypothetical protein